MPLVPLQIIEKWYVRDSWVYRNFAYIFVNPLWEKDIPRGRGVCVYFWSSILVGTAVRSLVGFILFCKWAAACLGAGLTFVRLPHLLKTTDRWCCKILQWENPSIKFSANDKEVVGLATVVCLILNLAVIIAIVALSFILFGLTYDAYGIGMYIPAVLLQLYLLVVLVCYRYKSENKGWDRCKVEWYTRSAGILFVLGSLYSQPKSTKNAGLMLGSFLKTVGHATWQMIVEIPSAFSWLGKWIGTIFLWTMHASLTVVFYTGHLLLYFGTAALVYFIIAFMAMALIGPVMDRLMPKPKWKIGGPEPSKGGKKDFNDRLESVYVMFYQYTSYGSSDWRSFVKKNFNHRLEAAARLISQTDSYYEFLDGMGGLSELERIVQAAEEKWRARLAELALKQKKRDELCKRVTEGIALGFTPVTWPALQALRGLSIVTVGSGKGLFWAASQCGTFFCLLWELAKAKKKGACPYLEFKDPKEEPPILH